MVVYVGNPSTWKVEIGGSLGCVGSASVFELLISEFSEITILDKETTKVRRVIEEDTSIGLWPPRTTMYTGIHVYWHTPTYQLPTQDTFIRA